MTRKPLPCSRWRGGDATTRQRDNAFRSGTADGGGTGPRDALALMNIGRNEVFGSVGGESGAPPFSGCSPMKIATRTSCHRDEAIESWYGRERLGQTVARIHEATGDEKNFTPACRVSSECQP